MPSTLDPPPPHQRQIVDFDPDDNDWEDDDAQLDGLGTTTHRSRNHAVPVIPVRKHRRVRGANTHATAETRSKKADKRQSLAADLAAWEVEREERAQELSDKHGMKLKEVRRRMLSASAFKPKRKVSVYNAKIGRIMATENEGRELGERLLMKDVKRMVRDDPSMLDGFTAEEEAEMVAELEEKRKTKFRGTRANNLAAGADAKRTVERMMVEITGLAERAGMIGFAMFTRGHIHDRTIPVMIQSWGALEFFREILKKDPADVAALFELWAVSRERGDTGTNTLLGMQQDCTKMITDGLCAVLAKTKVKMNFENYIKALVEGKNMCLVGWPEGVDFKHMSLQSKIGPLRILRDALRCGTVRWKVLSAGEKKRLVDQFREMVKTGEVQRTAREESSDDEEDAPARMTSKAVPKVSSRLSRVRPKKTAREEPSGDNDDDDDPPRADLPRLKGNAPRKPISEMTVEEKRARLVGRASGKTSKRARNEGGASGVDRPRKKVRRKENKRESEDGEERGRGKGSKRQRGAGKDDDEEEMRKKKKKRTGDNAQRAPAAKTTADDAQSAPTNTKPRPKPRMKPRPGASTTAATNGASTSGATATSSNGATTSTPATSPNSAAAATNRATSTSGEPTTSTGSASATPSNEAPATSSSGEPASSTGGANATPSNEVLATSSNPAAATTNSATSTSSAGATSSNEAPATSSQPARRNVVKGKAGRPPGLRV
ncbi:hypothetical protein DFH09DRAFT_1346988 [Mycena vulgaris]|nr:hypothetical protein DFH09DRAFT_1346988 [Mycena vulgaris]